MVPRRHEPFSHVDISRKTLCRCRGTRSTIRGGCHESVQRVAESGAARLADGAILSHTKRGHLYMSISMFNTISI